MSNVFLFPHWLSEGGELLKQGDVGFHCLGFPASASGTFEIPEFLQRGIRL